MTQHSNGPWQALRTNPESSSIGSTKASLPKELVSQAKEVTSNAADKAKEVVSSRVERGAGKSAGEIDAVARALHDTSKQLGDNSASPYIDKAADQLEKVSRYLRGATLPDIVNRVETFARKEPLLFLGGAFVLGLAGARFLKSSGDGTAYAGTRRTDRPRDTDIDRPTAIDPILTDESGWTGGGGER